MSTATNEPVVPVISDKDIRIYHSGGYYNSTPDNSLGGEISSFPLISGSLNGLFDRVQTNQAQTGIREYRCIYIKNTNQTRKLLKTKIWIETGTRSAQTNIEIAIGSAGINGVEPMIPDETVQPPMNFFSIPLEMPTEPNIGDLFPGDTIGLWVKWRVNAGAQPLDDDWCVIRIDGDREPESLTAPEGDPAEPPPGGCPQGMKWDPVAVQCVPDTNVVVCPTNYKYDPVTQRCVPISTPPPSVPNLKFAVISDTYPSIDSSNVFALARSRINITSSTTADNMSFLLFAGDATHIDGNVQPFIDFCQTLGPLFPSHIFPVYGNHDGVEDGLAQDEQNLRNTFPALGTTGYYTVTRRNIRIICLNTQASYTSTSAQFLFAKTELEKASADPNIRWIIVMFHKPIVTSAGHHEVLTDLRGLLWPLLDLHKVDLIINGHNHVYVRTKPIKYNAASPTSPTIMAATAPANNNYINVDGRTFITIGTGGRNANHTFDSSTAESFVAKRYLPPPYGCMIFTLQENGQQLAAEFINVSGDIVDSFMLSKPPASPPPPQTCPSGYYWSETQGRCLPNAIQCPAGQHWDPAQNRCVPDVAPPPPPPTSAGYPVTNVEWYYDAAPVLAVDQTIAADDHASDGVLMCSGASGVDSCDIDNGWLYIPTGGGNGRVYFDYHTRPRFDVNDQPGFNMAMTFKFIWVGNDNISVKDGNHGTDGFEFDGELVFGGLGFSLHESEVQSKAEYWHNEQGDEEQSAYPSGRSLQENKEYRCFFTLVTDRVGKRVLLNVWLDFGDGSNWVKVMNNRAWTQSNWDPGNVPSGDDQQQIEDGPSYIKRHHVWLRNNAGGADLPVKDIKIGTLPYIS
jgi:hypothetical protein